MSRNLFSVHLQLALQQPGCPICRLKAEGESRYLFGFLWEHVNDGPIRERLRASLGYCHFHAWRLVETESQAWGGGLGTGILYQDLSDNVIMGLRDESARVQELVGARPRGLLRASATRLSTFATDSLKALLARLGRPTDALPRRPISLRPQAACPACLSAEFSERSNLHWILQGCTGSTFREKYLRSDGLCLPHLLACLEMADDSAASRFLLDAASSRLAVLRRNLDEYLRKCNYQYHDEPKTAAELASWRGTVAFLAGERSA